ncbi:putative ABC transporter ATP-binding protein [Posidoniimonas polymericola]|uniref:Putative ABC transporter ATP-binding protein n=1 Tax=Posidoniimonas polymericola TaxID=2528002 RepID=A0A5C5YS34_9BACT|nr:ATP-binding cassette domain-containing protein [Posidoniimonas polymericola]TWT77762.1 putative ABC transporter ATP-binding protein [Posidoniimonas polymericola]
MVAPAGPEQVPKIAATDVTVTFGHQTVLRHVTVAAAPGETLAVIGESGCGKTVLLKTLIRLVNPTDGVVTFEGEPIAKLGERKITHLRRRLGFVFQNAALFDSMSIADNVAFPLRDQHRMDREEAYELVAERLAEVGLPASVMLKKPAELSGGMRKRVGLARALANSPEVLLYDEPTTGLDPIMSDVINELILRTKHRRHVTSIVVTHDMHSARKVADRIVMLYPVARLEDDEPQILFDGTPDEIMECQDKRVAQFVRGEAGERLEEMQRN